MTAAIYKLSQRSVPYSELRAGSHSPHIQPGSLSTAAQRSGDNAGPLRATMPLPTSQHVLLPQTTARQLAPSWSARIVRDIALVVSILAACGAGWLSASVAASLQVIDMADASAATRGLPILAVLLLVTTVLSSTEGMTLRGGPWHALMSSLIAVPAALIIVAMDPIDATASTATMMLIGCVAAAFIAACSLTDLLLTSGPIGRRLRTNVAIYGAGGEARTLRDIMAKERCVAFTGLFEERRSPGRVDSKGLDIAGSLADLLSLAEMGLVDEVIICLPRSAIARTKAIVERFGELPVDVRVTSASARELAIDEALPQSRIGRTTVVQVSRRPIRGWGYLVKALFDRVVGAVAIVALSPLFALIAVAIKSETKGPVFFRQKRHGVCGGTIVVWKFRTMSVMEDGAVVRQASKGDQRITKVGSFLRRTSLDELPQLINAVMGSMSIVGPRPHAVAHNEYYGGLIPGYGRRGQVRPGITGWAQINGFRGETRTPQEMAARVAHDVWYIRNWSLWLDLKIILFTPFLGLVHKNAY